MKTGLVVLLCLMACLSASAWDGGTEEADWGILSNQVVASRTQLTNWIAQVDAAGLSTDYASVSLTVVDRFLTYAQYDRDHPDVMSNAVEDIWWGDKIPDYANYHINLPFDEMQSCLDVSSNAQAELQQQLANQIVLQTPHDFSTGTVVLTNGSYTLDGSPAFPSTFTWMPADEDLLQAFGRIGGSFYQLTNLEPDETVTPAYLTNERNDAFDRSMNNIAPQQFFLGHKADAWMIATNSAITNGARNFVQYDTDSPQIRGWLTKLFEGFLPVVGGPDGSGDQPRMLLLANEPNFATREGGWLADNGVSENTMARYNDWLQARYTTVTNLNAVYGTSHIDFDAAETSMVMPIATNLQGGPVWYDWCRFNMDRINDFFSFLKAGAQANDPDASPVTIKILGPQLENVWRDEGMDLEYLAKLMDVQGADNKISPATAADLNIKESLAWTNDYAMDWVDQSMMLDFMKSISPGKAFYDSEWHGLSTGRWRDFSMDPDYVRAALWMGFTHGISAMQAWYWPRAADGSLSRGDIEAMIGSIVTLPEALDSYGRTFKELNAHAGSVTRLVQTDRRFMIYYCEESAIQDLAYIPEVERVYEALKLINSPVGFTTSTEISNLSSSTQTVIVPPAHYISDASLAKLQAFEAAGGSVVQVNGASTSFVKDEHGAARAGGSGLSPVATATLSDALATAEAFDSALDALMPDLPVEVIITDGSASAYGVLVFQTLEETGETTLALINVSKDSRTVLLQVAGQSAGFRDLITQRAVATYEQVMAPFDVMLLQTDESVPAPPMVPEDEVTVVEFTAGEGYSNGDLTLHSNWIGNAGNVIDTIGAGYNGAQGIVDVSLEAWKKGVYSKGCPAVSPGDEITLSTVFQFTSTNSVAGNRDLLSLVFYDSSAGSGDAIRAAFRRTAGANVDFLISHGGGNSSSSDVPSADAGLVSDIGTSDWLEFAATLTRGTASNDWSMTLSLVNLASSSVIHTFSSTGLVSTADFFAADTLYGAFSSSRPDAEISSRVIDSFFITVPGTTGWDTFVSDFGLSGAVTNDSDLDGRSDLFEYALGGNPTNSADAGFSPGLTFYSNGRVGYRHLRRSGTYPGITYLAEWTDSLVTGSWSSAWISSSELQGAPANYTEIERQLDGTNSLFFRLQITQP
jgi:hypothetical protein